MAGSLSDRMKRHELVTRSVLPPRSFMVVRVDGRSFHTYTRRLNRPFDSGLVAAMDAAAAALVAEIDGVVLAYTQSDEITVVATDLWSHTAQLWFGGVTQKVASVSASIATAAFLSRRFADGDVRPAGFDGRAFSLPSVGEVHACLLWRQLDCVRNSIQMLGRAHFSAAALHRKSNSDIQEMLMVERGVNWAKQAEGFKNGRVALRRDGAVTVLPAPSFSRPSGGDDSAGQAASAPLFLDEVFAPFR